MMAPTPTAGSVHKDGTPIHGPRYSIRNGLPGSPLGVGADRRLRAASAGPACATPYQLRLRLLESSALRARPHVPGLPGCRRPSSAMAFQLSAIPLRFMVELQRQAIIHRAIVVWIDFPFRGERPKQGQGRSHQVWIVDGMLDDHEGSLRSLWSESRSVSTLGGRQFP